MSWVNLSQAAGKWSWWIKCVWCARESYTTGAIQLFLVVFNFRSNFLILLTSNTTALKICCHHCSPITAMLDSNLQHRAQSKNTAGCLGCVHWKLTSVLLCPQGNWEKKQPPGKFSTMPSVKSSLTECSNYWAPLASYPTAIKVDTHYLRTTLSTVFKYYSPVLSNTNIAHCKGNVCFSSKITSSPMPFLY